MNGDEPRLGPKIAWKRISINGGGPTARQASFARIAREEHPQEFSRNVTWSDPFDHLHFRFARVLPVGAQSLIQAALHPTRHEPHAYRRQCSGI